MHRAGQSLWRSGLASEDGEEAGAGGDPAPSRPASQKGQKRIVKRLPTPFSFASNWTTRGTSNYGWVIFHQGGRYDFATGLFAFRDRDYSPILGRWVENDPIGFRGGDTSLYRYVNNNPVTLTDPTGNKWWEWIPIVSTIVHGVQIAWVPPEGTNVLDYATCKPWAHDCKKDADSAILKCDLCVWNKARQFIFDWCDLLIAPEALRAFVAGAGFLICKNGIKYGLRGGAGGAVTGGILLGDSIIDAGFVADGIVRILMAAKEASE